MTLGDRIVKEQRPLRSCLGVLNPIRLKIVTEVELQEVTVRHQCVGESKIWILLDSSPKIVDRFFKSVL